ncbi:hypothetical protein IWX49DRAFT_9216 [Phyllosticta citricarpa]
MVGVGLRRRSKSFLSFAFFSVESRALRAGVRGACPLLLFGLLARRRQSVTYFTVNQSINRSPPSTLVVHLPVHPPLKVSNKRNRTRHTLASFLPRTSARLMAYSMPLCAPSCTPVSCRLSAPVPSAISRCRMVQRGKSQVSVELPRACSRARAHLCVADKDKEEPKANDQVRKRKNRKGVDAWRLTNEDAQIKDDYVWRRGKGHVVSQNQCALSCSLLILDLPPSPPSSIFPNTRACACACCIRDSSSTLSPPPLHSAKLSLLCSALPHSSTVHMPLCMCSDSCITRRSNASNQSEALNLEPTR